MTKHETRDDKLVVAASGFTSLWAFTWAAAGAMPISAAVQGGLAVGGVMAGSGLTVLWWKLQTMRRILDDDEGADDAASTAPDDAPIVM